MYWLCAASRHRNASQHPIVTMVTAALHNGRHGYSPGARHAVDRAAGAAGQTAPRALSGRQRVTRRRAGGRASWKRHLAGALMTAEKPITAEKLRSGEQQTIDDNQEGLVWYNAVMVTVVMATIALYVMSMTEGSYRAGAEGEGCEILWVASGCLHVR